MSNPYGTAAAAINPTGKVSLNPSGKSALYRFAACSPDKRGRLAIVTIRAVEMRWTQALRSVALETQRAGWRMRHRVTRRRRQEPNGQLIRRTCDFRAPRPASASSNCSTSFQAQPIGPRSNPAGSPWQRPGRVHLQAARERRSNRIVAEGTAPDCLAPKLDARAIESSIEQVHRARRVQLRPSRAVSRLRHSLFFRADEIRILANRYFSRRGKAHPHPLDVGMSSTHAGSCHAREMVAAAPRLLLGRNSQRTFNRHRSKLLRAPLFSHTPQ